MSVDVRILVVEDHAILRRGMVRALRERWSFIEATECGATAVAWLKDREREPYDVVLTDLCLPDVGGMRVLEAARERDRRTAVLMISAHGTIENAVEAMRQGAFDFLQKPFELEQLEVRVAKAIEHAGLRRELASLRAERTAVYQPVNFVGRSPGLRSAIELAERAAKTRSTVLVRGETGTGKELIAGLVHALSNRADGPYVQVNCAAVPETLLESELFGHERGAFTGADATRVGRFEEADGGTLFLDEIGDMSPPTQAKLLRVLQDQHFTRLGGSTALRTDVRIVAATHHDLEAAIVAGRFREDLYFRLNVIGIDLPPLRERSGDVLLLAEHFLERFSRELGGGRRRLSAEARERLVRHPWPGNVRELRNVIERAVMLSDGNEIEVIDFLRPIHPTQAPELRRGGDRPEGDLSLREVQRELVLEALRRSSFVQKDAAKLLGVSRRKLNYMVQRMGITHPTWRRNRAGPGEEDEPTSPRSGPSARIA